MSELFKQMMLKENPAFCMYPWIHLHTTPEGKAAPCCIAKSCEEEDGIGDSRTQSLMDLVNSEKMKKLRLDMLAGIKNEECRKCYWHEESGIRSSRQAANADYDHTFNEVIDYTNLEDGSLTNFEMKYFDIRFSNICNFKCRTCGAAYSSQWENEDLKHKMIGKPVPKNNNPQFLKDVIEQIPYMEVAYFAGGEPLITEEHYILLEEMIKQKKTNIQLRYNTNLSNFKYKDKDLLALWKRFDYKVSIYASIDHFGERAEYIRHGTDWGKVESNFLLALKQPFIDIQMNTVVSVFNFVTLLEFYQYLLDKHLLKPECYTYSLFNTASPEYLTSQILPLHLKEAGKAKLHLAIAMMNKFKFREDQVQQLVNTYNWVDTKHGWEEQKLMFRNEVRRLDAIRGENFVKVFPELADMLEDKPRAEISIAVPETLSLITETVVEEPAVDEPVTVEQPAVETVVAQEATPLNRPLRRPIFPV
jgi:hypothetical protein